jgi:thiamine biosynthesis lipoprotein
VRAALAAAEATDGLVDPTLGCHLAEVGYDRDFASLPADGPAVDPATIGEEDAPWQRVRVDDARGTVTVPPGCALDLGATAKARGADRAAARISAELGTGVLVSLGGDVAAAGASPADGWPVQVAVSFRAERGSDETVLLTGGGLATSSPGARRWRRGGREQHHILDPRTRRPVEATWEAVSVAAPTCVDANTAATAAVVLGAHALPWLRGTSYPSRLVASDGTVHRLNGWPETGVWSR